MKYSRAQAAATVGNGKIYVCGGREGFHARLASVECFDPKSGVWTELTEMPTPLAGHSLVFYRTKLVLMGGRDDDDRCTAAVLKLDPLKENGQWKKLRPMNNPCSDFTGIVLDREIITIDGKSAPLQVEVYDGKKWQYKLSFPPETCSSAVLIPPELGDRLCLYTEDIFSCMENKKRLYRKKPINSMKLDIIMAIYTSLSILQ